jgi:hypothetical protein
MEQAERQPHDDIRAECPNDSERDRHGQWGRTSRQTDSAAIAVAERLR